MKKVFIEIACFLLFIGYICLKDNPNFTPYLSKTYDTDYWVQSDIYELSAIKNEMTAFAQTYENRIWKRTWKKNNGI